MLSRIDRKSASLTGVVYARLRLAIIEGRFGPGEMLVEEHLANELAVSRTPLREALAKLEHEGLIESIPYRGTFVANPSPEDYIQILQVRERLEALAIELAIDRIPDSELARVGAVFDERRPLITQGDLQAHFDCNQELHGLAPRYSGNAILEQFIENLEGKTQIFRYKKANQERNLAEILSSAQEHADILDAYRRRDGVRAIELMTGHLRVTRERLAGSQRDAPGG